LIVPRGRADVLHEFSTPLAAQAIMVLLGAPLADREEFTGYSHLFLSTDPADQARVPEAMAWMASYIAVTPNVRSLKELPVTFVPVP